MSAEDKGGSNFTLKKIKMLGFVSTCVAPTLEHDKLSLPKNSNRKKSLFTRESVRKFVKQNKIKRIE